MYLPSAVGSSASGISGSNGCVLYYKTLLHFCQQAEMEFMIMFQSKAAWQRSITERHCFHLVDITSTRR